jgi:hypothetical protein
VLRLSQRIGFTEKESAEVTQKLRDLRSALEELGEVFEDSA